MVGTQFHPEAGSISFSKSSEGSHGNEDKVIATKGKLGN